MSLQPWAMLLTFSLAGATLKLSDHFGEKGGGIHPYLTAGLSGVAFGLLIARDEFSSSLVIGIIVGVTVAAKVNRPNLIFGALVTFLSSLLMGYEQPVLWLLLAVSFSSFIDEVGHDRFGSGEGFMSIFFRYRSALKIVVAMLAASSLLPYPQAIGFFCFDVSYDVVGWLLKPRL